MIMSSGFGLFKINQLELFGLPTTINVLIASFESSFVIDIFVNLKEYGNSICTYSPYILYDALLAIFDHVLPKVPLQSV